MSQTAIILSCGGDPHGYGTTNWTVDFSYQLDAGGTGQARILVGSNQNPAYYAGLTSALWASPTSTITVSPNPPGTTNPVLLPCPDVVKWAAFGVPTKGFPVA